MNYRSLKIALSIDRCTDVPIRRSPSQALTPLHIHASSSGCIPLKTFPGADKGADEIIASSRWFPSVVVEVISVEEEPHSISKSTEASRLRVGMLNSLAHRPIGQEPIGRWRNKAGMGTLEFDGGTVPQS